ncbi:MAG: hypothetical protein H6886_09430 [Hyphomicrobiaceae bacterium]|nr:hypothetical protein [Hyphomicrobiaceae bacterium]
MPFRRTDRASLQYRKAFEAYFRRGTPIDLRGRAALEEKAEPAARNRPTTHYIWRTRRDRKVRPSHAANDGKIFAWGDPPPTGHPGEDYGFRCWAEPYVPDAREFFDIEIRDVSDEGPPRSTEALVWWYLLERGRAVTVRQTGYLRAVAAEYDRIAIDDPKRLPGQIADVARSMAGSSFNGAFGRPYDMTPIVFSLGHTTIGGTFRGSSRRSDALLELRGTISFNLRDEFRDPLDIDEHLKSRLRQIDVLVENAVVKNILRVTDIADYVARRVQLPAFVSGVALLGFLIRRIQQLLKLPENIPSEIPGATPYDIIATDLFLIYDKLRNSRKFELVGCGTPWFD